MYINTSYERRETLTTNELQRLLAALEDEVVRYQYAIRNYPPERMTQYGSPFLHKLEAKVMTVERLLGQRSAS